MFTYDGDTPQDARRAVRARANLVLTNPDMLHSGILPHHTKWASALPEPPLRRHRRAARLPRRVRLAPGQRAAPAQAHLRATTARRRSSSWPRRPSRNPGRAGAAGSSASRSRRSPRAARRPARRRSSATTRPSSTPSWASARRISARRRSSRIRLLRDEDRRRSSSPRAGSSTEVLLTAIKQGVADRATGDSGIVRGYRGGYLPNRRRAVEQELRDGRGARRRVDERAGARRGHRPPGRRGPGRLPGHDRLAVAAGGPRRAPQRSRRRRSWWRPARRSISSWSTHPDYLFGTPPEHARVNPDNPFILVNHLKCAAFELPIARGRALRRPSTCAASWPRSRTRACCTGRGRRYHWASETYPADHISLRTVTTDNFLVIDTTARDEKQTKKRQIIAEVDWGSAFATIYPKAIYLVESVPYEVQELHFREDEEKVAYVKRVNVDYFTDAVSAKGVWILQRLARGPRACRLSRRAGRGAGGREGGRLQEDQAWARWRTSGSGEVELPQQEMQTTSAWLTVPPATLDRVSRSREELIDGLRAVTYLLHHLAPIFLLCDIRDLGSWLGDTTPADDRRRGHARVGASSGSCRPSTSIRPSISTTRTPGASAWPSALFEILPDLLRHGLRDAAGVRLRGRLSLLRRSRERGRPPRQDHRRSPPRARSPPEARCRQPRRSPPRHPAHRDARGRRGRPPSRSEQVVGGELLDTGAGHDRASSAASYPLAHRHGRRAARRRAGGAARAARARSRGSTASSATPGGLLFLDTETTGLAGGTGTYAFLVGAALARGRSARGRRSTSCATSTRSRRCWPRWSRCSTRATAVVTFNGAGFDLPLLETRFVLARRRWPADAAAPRPARARRAGCGRAGWPTAGWPRSSARCSAWSARTTCRAR